MLADASISANNFLEIRSTLTSGASRLPIASRQLHATEHTPASCDSDVLFIEDLARLLRTSRTTIERRRRDRSFPFPQIAAIDRRPRWSRTAVEHMIAAGTSVTTGRLRFGRRGNA